MWNKNRRGSNLIYIIILMAILGILAAAYSAVSIYSARSAGSSAGMNRIILRLSAFGIPLWIWRRITTAALIL